MYLQVFLKTTKYKTNKWITTCTDLINFYLSTYLFWLSSLKRKQKCQFQVYRIIGCRKIEVWCQTGQNGQHDYIFHLRELEIGGLFLFLFPIFSYQVSLLMTFSGSFNNSLPNILRLGGGRHNGLQDGWHWQPLLTARYTAVIFEFLRCVWSRCR